MGDAKDEREKNIFIRDENVSGVGDDPVDCTDWLFFFIPIRVLRAIRKMRRLHY